MLKGKIIIKNKRLASDVEKSKSCLGLCMLNVWFYCGGLIAVQLERYYRHSEILEEEDEIEAPEEDSCMLG